MNIRRYGIIILVACSIVAAGALFKISYHVKRLETKQAVLARTILQEEGEIRVLETEWVYLNRPARLERLVQRHLPLKPILGEQIITKERQ